MLQRENGDGTSGGDPDDPRGVEDTINMQRRYSLLDSSQPEESSIDGERKEGDGGGGGGKEPHHPSPSSSASSFTSRRQHALLDADGTSSSSLSSSPLLPTRHAGLATLGSESSPSLSVSYSGHALNYVSAERCDPSASESDINTTAPLAEPIGLRRTSSASIPAAIAEEAQELILNVMDLVEDEWDGHAYEDVIPLEVKLTIEEAVFGWSHLISNILGHAAFTLVAFGAVYYSCGTLLPTYVWLKWTLATVAAVSSFRMVRRRRKVWFRAPYGSDQYRQDAERRLREVKEADATSWLGRIRKLRSERKVRKQLKRAETNFMVRERRRRDYQQQVSLVDSGASTSTKARRRPSFQTDPIPVMQSIQHDQILFTNGPIQRILYTHGGYFGAAPFLLNNPHWISILRHLMPDVYIEISRRVHKSPQHRLIHWAENNPVVAAYGTAQALENSTHCNVVSLATPPNIEWDIFLDPQMVESVSVVLRERERLLTSIDPDFFQRRSSPNHTRGFTTIAALKPMEPILIASHAAVSSSQLDILRYYNSTLKKRVRHLVDKMLIAHGNLTQLLLEQTGYGKQYVYSRVRRTRRTLGGGIYARQWMSVFAESLRIGVLQEDEVEPPPPTPAQSLPASFIGRFDSDVSSCPDTSIARSAEIVQAVSKCKDTFGLVLDLKSRHVPKQVLACVVDTLRGDGVRVEGIGSFAIDDIRGLSQYTTNPVREIMLFHSAGDVQLACHDGRVQPGDSVLFNGGSLIWSPANMLSLHGCVSSFDALRVKQSYRLYPFAHVTRQSRHSTSTGSLDSVTSSASTDISDQSGSITTSMVTSSSTIEQYKRYYDLSIGLYVQEFAIDEAAVNLLVDYVNENQHIYDLGLNWGGVNGITIRGIQPDRFTCTDGYWNQRHVGKDWDASISPPISRFSAHDAPTRFT
jgi:hypothetical protein